MSLSLSPSTESAENIPTAPEAEMAHGASEDVRKDLTALELSRLRMFGSATDAATVVDNETLGQIKTLRITFDFADP